MAVVSETAPEAHDAGTSQLADKDDTQLSGLVDAVHQLLENWLSEHQGVPREQVCQVVVEFTHSYCRSSARRPVLQSIERDDSCKGSGGVAAVCAGLPKQDISSAAVLVDVNGEMADQTMVRVNTPSPEHANSPPQVTCEKLPTPAECMLLIFHSIFRGVHYVPMGYSY